MLAGDLQKKEETRGLMPVRLRTEKWLRQRRMSQIQAISFDHVLLRPPRVRAPRCYQRRRPPKERAPEFYLRLGPPTVRAPKCYVR